MEDRLFLFLGQVSHEQSFIVVSHTILVSLVILILAKLATGSLKQVPKGSQNIFEAYIEGVMSMARDVIGSDEKAKKYIPLIATLGIIVFFSNMIGVVPGFESPTANINFTLSLALIVFIYYNFEGIKDKGVIKYFKHFAGPVWWLAWLMFPIEIISHISRIISLSFRLFGSISGDDMFLMVLLMLAPWIAPLPAFALLFAFGILQAFIFMMLTTVYIGGAIAEDEDH
jgi:F-type H+-transporting ATPase subunit a